MLNNDYKDYFIVIVIDEIDRLAPTELIYISRLLDILKKINKCSNSICMFCRDDKYLVDVYLPGSEGNINFLNYFKKFFEHDIKLYRKTIPFLTLYILKRVREITTANNENLLKYQEGYDKKIQNILTILETL